MLLVVEAGARRRPLLAHARHLEATVVFFLVLISSGRYSMTACCSRLNRPERRRGLLKKSAARILTLEHRHVASGCWMLVVANPGFGISIAESAIRVLPPTSDAAGLEDGASVS